MYELMQPLLDFLTIKTGTIGGALLLAFIYWARNFLLKPFIFFLPRVQNRKFERQYLKSLEERERILTINGLGGSWGNDVELSSIYVPLKLGPRMSEAVNGEDSIACTPPNCDRFTTEDILLSNDRVTILGQPGSGKSTLVRYLALQHACNWRLSSRIKNRVLRLLEKYHSATQRSLPIPLKKRFPILVRLRTLQDERGLQLTVNDLPRLCAGDDIGARCPDEFFANHLRNGHCIVFLDGLDEIIETRRSRVREQIYNLVTNSDYKRNAFILTSRSTSYEKVRTFKEQFTCGFTYEDILLFAKKWYQIQQNSPCPRLAPPSNAIENTEKKAKALVDAIYQSDNARRLAVNPLLLSMLAVVHASDTSLPSRRAEFYQLCMPALLGDIALKRGLHVKFQPVVKEQILKPIAYWMHRTECKLFVEESKLRLQIAEQLPEVGYSRNASDIDEFYTETIGRGDVLMRVNSSENAFVHRTFQEYLAAKHIADLPNSRDIILYRLHDPWWEQVVLFYVGIISGQEAGEFIEILLQRRKDPLRQNLFLATRCLGELVKVKSSIQLHIISELAAVFSNADYEGLRQEARRALLYLGNGPWGMPVRQHLTKLLKSNHKNTRYQAVLVLVQLEKSKRTLIIPKEIIETLIDMLCHKNIETRLRAHYALGELDNITEGLLALTKSPVAKLRGGAALALGMLGQTEAGPLDALVGLLQDVKPQVRWRATAALGWLGKADKDATAGLLTNLQHFNDNVRGMSASTLGEIGKSSEDVVNLLIKTLSDPVTEVAGRAASALGTLGRAEDLVIKGLLGCLDSDTQVQARATAALGELGKADPPVVDLIIKHLQEDTDPEVKSRAATAMGWLGLSERRVIEALLPNLADNNVNVVESATYAIGWLMKNDKQVLTILTNLLDSTDTNMRAYAVSAIGRLGVTDSTVISNLLEKIGSESDGDSHEIVRIAATSALRRLGQAKPKVVRGLTRILGEDKCSEVRWRAAFALGALEVANHEVIDALVMRLEDNSEDREVRLRSADALARLGETSDMVSSALVGFLRNTDDEEVCWHAAIALGWLGDSRDLVVNALADKMNNSKTSQVRSSCARALGKLGHANAHIVKGLVARVGDPNSEVRARSATALADLANVDHNIPDYVANLLQDNNNDMRTNATMALYVLIQTLGQGLQQCISEDKLKILGELLKVGTPIGHPIVGKKSTVRDVAWWLLQEYNRVYPNNYRKAYAV